tara:strand:+ start:553 stop:918 length:366 start_codon:yes stop_codon:yes gene_type:complete
MLYLFLGHAIIGLIILLGIPMEDKLSSGQYAFVIGFSIFLDFLPTLGYLVGRYLSKSEKLHWETLVSFGVIVGVFTQVLLPELGLGGNEEDSLWYIPATLFLAIAFIPPKIELWRVKPVDS